MMHQVLVAKNGHLTVADEPLPEMGQAGWVTVQTERSGISIGTELLTLEASLDSDEAMHMGYQTTGIVTEARGDMESDFAPGTRVACYGSPYVYHASQLAVPRHLVTRLPDKVSFEEGSYCALAAVALHGFRNTGCTLGETVAVVGLGNVGNIAAQCAAAAGCRVYCCEMATPRIAAARAAGLNPFGSMQEMTAAIMEATAGHGADAVMVAVKNCDDGLLAAACDCVRRLGKIVILGLSDAVLPRNVMFAREATVMVSRAAGWGRYDKQYEAEGMDYPYEHARWTEHRNLEEAIRLMAIGRLKLKPLITDEIAVEQAPHIYEKLKTDPSTHMGIVIRWTP
jgi:threonine dehydrogenase-like Zn-dependent dehydrogenase